MTGFDRWFIARDSEGRWCVWLATRDDDPAPVCFAYLQACGRIVTDGRWPFTPDQIADAMESLQTVHAERQHRALRDAIAGASR